MRALLPLLAFLALVLSPSLASRDSVYTAGTPLENAALLKRLNVGASIFNHVLMQDPPTDADKSGTEEDLEARFKDFNVAYIRMWLRNEVERIWDLKLETPSHIHKIDSTLIELIKENPDRWGGLNKDCDDHYSIYLQLIGHAYARTKDTFDEAWSGSFNETYDDVIGDHADDTIEEGVSRIVEDVYKTSLDDLNVDWKEALVRITRAIYKFRKQKPHEGEMKDYVDEERYRKEGSPSVVLASDAEDQGTLNAPVSFLALQGDDDTNDKAKVLETLPDGKSPKDVAQVYLNLLKEKMNDEDFKEDWVDAWDKHYNEHIENDNDFNEKFKNLVKEAFEDANFKPDCGST